VTTAAVGTVVNVDPTTLLVDFNVRTDARLTPAFVASIRDHGVLQPVVAVLTPDGALRVRYGHRRTLAAVEAGRDTIPAYIAGDEGSDTADQVTRVITQWTENTQREGLTISEQVGVVEQLTAFGLSPAQITRRAKITRKQVDAALAVAKSDLARKATGRYADLDLTRAAVIAEFSDDPDAVTALIAASRTGQFDHFAQRARDDRAAAQARQAAHDALTGTGVTVIDVPGWSDTTQPLTRLVSGDDEADLSPDQHATCPGHVAWLTEGSLYLDADGQPLTNEQVDGLDEDQIDALTETTGWLPVYGCADPTGHGHHDRYHRPGRRTNLDSGTGSAAGDDLGEDDREAARARRRLVIDNNKAWASAETVRREWVAGLLTRKTAPKGTSTFLATALTLDPEVLHSVAGNRLATTWLTGQGHDGHGYSTAVADAAADATDSRALALALGHVLACHEATLTKDTWRRDGTHAAHGRYLRFLAESGYTLSDVETYAAGPDTA
jgi:ParB family chromosome partitioning protein